MTKTYAALEGSPLIIVEMEDGKPVRLVDIGEHVRTVYAKVTYQELWEFAHAQRKARRKLFTRVHARMSAALGRRPTWQELEAEPELQGYEYLDSGAIKRLGPLEKKLADWNPNDKLYGFGKYDKGMLNVLCVKTQDPVIQMFFDAHYHRRE